MFKCYIRVPGASTNTENKKEQPSNFLVFFGKPFSANLWKKRAAQISLPVT